MLMSNEFVTAEDKYRREALRDQNQNGTKTGRAGRTVTVLLVAGAVALAACGVPQDADGGVANVSRTPSAILTDPGPPWQPNFPAIVPVSPLAPAIEFGGMAAPSWQPNQKALEEILGVPDTGVIGESEPTGHPNYGRLATYLGEEPASGPR